MTPPAGKSLGKWVATSDTEFHFPPPKADACERGAAVGEVDGKPTAPKDLAGA